MPWIRAIEEFEESEVKARTASTGSLTAAGHRASAASDAETAIRRDHDLIRAYRLGNLETLIAGAALEDLAKKLSLLSRNELEELLLSVFLGNSALERSAARLRFRLAAHRGHGRRVSRSRSEAAATSARVKSSRTSTAILVAEWRQHIESRGWKSHTDIPRGARTEFAREMYRKHGRKKDWPYRDEALLARRLKSLEKEIFGP